LIGEVQKADSSARHVLTQACASRPSLTTKPVALSQSGSRVLQDNSTRADLKSKVLALEHKIDTLYLQYDRLVAVDREKTEELEQKEGESDEEGTLLKEVVALFDPKGQVGHVQAKAPTVHQAKMSVRTALLQSFHTRHMIHDTSLEGTVKAAAYSGEQAKTRAVAHIQEEMGQLAQSMAETEAQAEQEKRARQSEIHSKDAEIKELETQYEQALAGYEQLNIGLLAAEAQEAVKQTEYQLQVQAASDWDDICGMDAGADSWPQAQKLVGQAAETLQKAAAAFKVPATLAAAPAAPATTAAPPAPTTTAAPPAPTTTTSEAPPAPVVTTIHAAAAAAAAPHTKHHKEHHAPAPTTTAAPPADDVDPLAAAMSDAGVTDPAPAVTAAAPAKAAATPAPPAPTTTAAADPVAPAKPQPSKAHHKRHTTTAAPETDPLDAYVQATAAPTITHVTAAPPAAPAADAESTDPTALKLSTLQELKGSAMRSHKHKHKVSAQDDFLDGIFKSASGAMPSVYQAWTPNGPAPAPVQALQTHDAPAPAEDPKPEAPDAAAAATDDDDAPPAKAPQRHKHHHHVVVPPADDGGDDQLAQYEAAAAATTAAPAAPARKTAAKSPQSDEDLLAQFLPSDAPKAPASKKSKAAADDDDPLAQFDKQDPPAKPEHKATPAADADPLAQFDTPEAAAPARPTKAAKAADPDPLAQFDSDAAAPKHADPAPAADPAPVADPPARESLTQYTGSHKHGHHKHHHESKDDQYMDGVFDTAAGALPVQYQTWRPDGASAAPAPAPQVFTEISDNEPGLDMSPKSVTSWRQTHAAGDDPLAKDAALLQLDMQERPSKGVSFLQMRSRLGGEAIDVAGKVLDEASKALRSNALSQLSRRMQQQSMHEALEMLQHLQHAMSRRVDTDPKKAKVMQWCEYLDQNMQAAAPLKAAKAKVREAAHALSAATDTSEAFLQQINSLQPLVSDADQEAQQMTTLAHDLAAKHTEAAAKLTALNRKVQTALAQLAPLGDDPATAGQARAARDQLLALQEVVALQQGAMDTRFEDLHAFTDVMLRKRSQGKKSLEKHLEEFKTTKEQGDKGVAAETKNLGDAQAELNKQTTALETTKKHCNTVSAQLRLAEERKSLEVTAVRTALRTLQASR